MPFVELMPDVATWDPEMFPGLKILVWLRPRSACKCKSMKKNMSCDCNVRVVIFDTGKVNIPGCKRFRDVQLANKLLRDLVEDEDFHDSTKQLPRSQRFEARRQKILKAKRYLDVEDFIRKPKAKLTKRESTYNADMTAIRRKFKTKKLKTVDTTLPPLVNACLLAQVANVEWILSYDRSQVDQALVEMGKIAPEDRNERIMYLLRH